MKLIIFLGNPGAEYALTRHNAGFIAADELTERLGCGFSNKPEFKAHIAKAAYNSESLMLIKPQTYMNLSGEALAAVKNFYKIDTKDLLIVYDDLSLELGKMRFRNSGSAGGHNGIKSIIRHLGAEKFDRLKIGIGPQPPFMKAEDYVLQKFSDEEIKKLPEIMKTAADAVLYSLEYGIQKAQNKYN